MAAILQLTRELEAPPQLVAAAGMRVRTYAGAGDIVRWLEIRHRAFARQRIGIAAWSEADFRREFLDKPWWSPQHLWFAEAEPSLLRLRDRTEWTAVGTVALAFRGGGENARPVVHWLAVLPQWRRRGVGRALMGALERRAWELGYRQIWLETHAAWEAAVEMYRRMGYRAAAPTETHDIP